jgi:hypothetical protein
MERTLSGRHRQARRIGAVIRVPAGPEYDAARNALEAIDRVHVVRAVPRIPLQLRDDLRVRGRIVFGGNGLPIAIQIKRGLPDAELTVLHEIGHLLDATAIGEGEFFGRSFDRLATPVQDALIGWGRAVERSATHRSLLEIAQRGSFAVELEHGDTIYVRLPPGQQLLVNYLLEVEEVFARSYVQYIAAVSGDPRIQALIAADRDSDGASLYPAYWDADDFEPIRRALDALFDMLGWLP